MGQCNVCSGTTGRSHQDDYAGEESYGRSHSQVLPETQSGDRGRQAGCRENDVVPEDHSVNGNDCRSGHKCIVFLHPDVEYLPPGAKEYDKAGKSSADWLQSSKSGNALSAVDHRPERSCFDTGLDNFICSAFVLHEYVAVIISRFGQWFHAAIYYRRPGAVCIGFGVERVGCEEQGDVCLAA